ncbi:GNAT family N-acetyltransferase [Streptococcus parauberis]|uniref:GNAT family N-acetyltransferase n=1 Tax=Streptococcus parauberis TaxID=1348 RepID=UPI000CCDF556|nr:GNAT family N-acetyltransferase [Streptococcus parauberis]PNY18216.1 putative acetyltransferase [Streptococcus parauberis]
MIRKASNSDLSRIAEILVYNNRLYYYPIFKDIQYSFQRLTVKSVMTDFINNPILLENTFIFEDLVIKGFISIKNNEISKLYVDPFFQSEGIGSILLVFSVKQFKCNKLWVLEKNSRARLFYEKHSFENTGSKKFEEGTSEQLILYQCKKDY